MVAAKNDREVVALIDSAVANSVGYHDSVLRRERDEVAQYYDLELPKRNSKGQSSYVSQDVYDSVMAMHAQILETFCGNRRIVKFAPTKGDTRQICDLQTEYCTSAIFDRNDGYGVMHDVIHDGLTSRVGVVKVWWDESAERVERKLPELMTQGELDAADETFGPEVVDIKAIPVEDGGSGGMFEVYVTELVDTSGLQVVAVPPEEVLVSKKAKNAKDAYFVGHRTKKTYEDLREMGLTKDEITSMGEECWVEDSEVAERFEDVDGGEIVLDELERTSSGRSVWLIEGYVRADLDGSETRKLWKVLKAGNFIVSKEPVQRHPFLFYSPLRKPHRLWGDNYAKRVFSTQNTKTALIRAIVDHAMVTTNPRWAVLKGAVPRPQELQDNRLGGIVNINRENGVLPLPQNPLNPYIFQTTQLIDAENEDTTGISRLSQGLNKDAISKQNSAALVEQLTTNSQTRQKITARNFASFMVDLYLFVSDLVIENATQEDWIEVAGEFVPVSPASWRRRTRMIVDVHLGYGESEREAQKLMMIHGTLIQDPDMRPLYTPDGRFRMWKRIMELQGLKDTDSYVVPPDKAQPPPPDPMMQAEMQAKQVEVQTKQAEAALKQQEAQWKHEREMMQLQLDREKAQAEHQIALAKLDLDKQKMALDARIAEQEMAVVKQKADTDSLTAIASPNS